MTVLTVTCGVCKTEGTAEIKETFTHRIELRPPMQWVVRYTAHVESDRRILVMRAMCVCRNCACMEKKT